MEFISELIFFCEKRICVCLSKLNIFSTNHVNFGESYALLQIIRIFVMKYF